MYLPKHNPIEADSKKFPKILCNFADVCAKMLSKKALMKLLETRYAFAACRVLAL